MWDSTTQHSIYDIVVLIRERRCKSSMVFVSLTIRVLQLFFGFAALLFFLVICHCVFVKPFPQASQILFSICMSDALIWIQLLPFTPAFIWMLQVAKVIEECIWKIDDFSSSHADAYTFFCCLGWTKRTAPLTNVESETQCTIWHSKPPWKEFLSLSEVVANFSVTLLMQRTDLSPCT